MVVESNSYEEVVRWVLSGQSNLHLDQDACTWKSAAQPSCSPFHVFWQLHVLISYFVLSFHVPYFYLLSFLPYSHVVCDIVHFNGEVKDFGSPTFSILRGRKKFSSVQGSSSWTKNYILRATDQQEKKHPKFYCVHTETQ